MLCKTSFTEDAVRGLGSKDLMGAGSRLEPRLGLCVGIECPDAEEGDGVFTCVELSSAVTPVAREAELSMRLVSI